MKKILQTCILFAFTFLFLACNKDEKEPRYATKFHYFAWEDVDTVPLILPSFALDRTFQIKDGDGYSGGIKGVPDLLASSQLDTVYVDNAGLDSDLKSSILSDTIRGRWFTIITEENRRLRIILDKNEETEKRYLSIAVWVYALESTPNGVPVCEQLVIGQLPSKKE